MRFGSIDLAKLAARAEVRIECLPEDIPVRGNALASGDAEEDKRCEDRILEDLESNEWAWCCVRVTAKLGQFQGEDYLGACSYANEEEFKRGGYFEQMREQAIEDLARNMEAARETLESL